VHQLLSAATRDISKRQTTEEKSETFFVIGHGVNHKLNTIIACRRGLFERLC
jgi:hypothetical protein